MTAQNQTHGASWLNVLLALSQFVLLLILIFGSLWLLITLPVWKPDAPRIPLPMKLVVEPESSLLQLSPPALPTDPADVLKWRGDIEVKFTNPWHQWLYIFFGLQAIALGWLTVRYLRHFVAAVALGQVLTRDNARLLRWAGILMILGPIYAGLIATGFEHLVLDGIDAEGARLVIDWAELTGGSLTLGWVVLIISEALRRGSVLEDEQALTV